MVSFLLTAVRLLRALGVAIKEKVFLSLLTTLLLINMSGVLFYTSVEGWSYVDAIYFSWISLIPTSIDIGYAPVTTFGKIFTMMYLVVGVGLMISLLAMIAKAVLRFDDDETGRTSIKQRLDDRRKVK
ncbi:potassium channel family protein [Caryophanon tenue]|uniref:Ion channel protein n=1 Tax=Caryophanon tenue TaxID=33978 RepID=A0A1C0Y7E3_9BACL|nr:potassium channel family protein [Caryophanon tenue]OCS83078.1 Ion channel protein [Caryophanon tenue]